MKKIFVLCFCSIICFQLAAQEKYQNTTIDEVINNLYASISGGIDQPRNKEQFFSVFDSTGRMQIASGADPKQRILRTITPQQYMINSEKRLMEIGFEEKEIHRIAETFGSVTHVFSTYESTLMLNGKKETIRGINSIQLFFNGKRYFILSVYWEGDTKNNIVPAKYLN